MGTEPSTIHPTSRKFTVFLAMCTAAPKGRMNTAATRSLEIAVDGLTPNSRISIGVMSAPPPAPVRPTRKPDDGAAQDDVRIDAHMPTPPLTPTDIMGRLGVKGQWPGPIPRFWP